MRETKKNSISVPAREALNLMDQTIESKLDPMGMVTPLVHAQVAWLSHPKELAQALSDLGDDMLALQWHAWQRLFGAANGDIEKPHPDDTRFSDPLWDQAAPWDILKEYYLLLTHHLQDKLYETPGLSAKDRSRAAFWWRKWLNAMAPTNFFWSNPVAMKKALETRGESLMQGLQILLSDLRAGTVQMTSPEDFSVGKNLATTPGKVVFRNRLLEVIHYTPTQAKNHKIPVVIVTPWINKYYILDLTPKKSMIKFLLDQGFSVFITSWKNPDAQMRDVSFDDYITDGVGAIVDCARGVSGADKVHAVGYCIGGAALTTYMAWANRRFAADKVPVTSVTLFTTLVDYRRPGDIEVFLDEGSLGFLARNMKEKGFLDGKEMASAFRLLRSNSLIWHYVVHGYLYGEKPPPFDVLYWNMDTTRMPARMHEWYLREFYMNNNLVRTDQLTIAGEKIDLARIKQPLYTVAAADDHVDPWKSTFKVNSHVSGKKRYVLSSSGHILGIVNPVVNPPKREFWVGPVERHDSAEEWRSRAQHHAGSWWEDWMAWLKPQSGDLVEALPVATKGYPALADAPGVYVLEP